MKLPVGNIRSRRGLHRFICSANEAVLCVHFLRKIPAAFYFAWIRANGSVFGGGGDIAVIVSSGF